MDDLLNQLSAIPLDGEDLMNMASKMGNSKTGWITYDALTGIKDINDLFDNGRLNSVFILLQIHNDAHMPQVGHWVVLTLNDDKKLSYYDPYALTIEQDIMVTGESNLLPQLLQGIDVDVNRFKHQRFKDDVQTCGRHTAIRAFFHFMNNSQYNDNVIMPMLKSREVKDADTFANLMTAFLSKSDLVVKMFFRQKLKAPVARMMAALPRGSTDPNTTHHNQIGGVLFR